MSTTAALCILSLLDAVYAHYTPTWAVHVPGGTEAANAVAGDHGFINLGEVSVSLSTAFHNFTFDTSWHSLSAKLNNPQRGYYMNALLLWRRQ